MSCATLPLLLPGQVSQCYKSEFVPEFILSILAVIRVFVRSRSDTALEVLALRQQIAVLKRKRPRPTLNSRDRLFWTGSPPLLVSLERCPRYRQARNRY
jgi:hypothetical protein